MLNFLFIYKLCFKICIYYTLFQDKSIIYYNFRLIDFCVLLIWILLTFCPKFNNNSRFIDQYKKIMKILYIWLKFSINKQLLICIKFNVIRYIKTLQQFFLENTCVLLWLLLLIIGIKYWLICDDDDMVIEICIFLTKI